MQIFVEGKTILFDVEPSESVTYFEDSPVY